MKNCVTVARYVVIVLFVTALARSLWATEKAPTTNDAKSLEQRLNEIKPRTEELRWKTLPWQPNLHTALKVARKRRKPIFVLCTDGDFTTGNC